MISTAAPTSPTSPKPTAVFSLKVLTVNVHKGFTTFNRRFMLHELREAVRRVDADVVFLQEIVGSHRRHARRLAHFPQEPHYEFLADSIWGQFAYGRNAVYSNGHHGNAVLSKFPIVRYQNHNISVSGPERRGMLHCVLQPPGCPWPVHAVCVHLSLQEHHRQQQLRRICALVNGLDSQDKVVLTGDFNDWRCRAHDVLRENANLHEVFVQSTGQSPRAFPASMPMLAPDRIYVRNACPQATAPVHLPKKPWDALSDHAPLAAAIALR